MEDFLKNTLAFLKAKFGVSDDDARLAEIEAELKKVEQVKPAEPKGKDPDKNDPKVGVVQPQPVDPKTLTMDADAISKIVNDAVAAATQPLHTEIDALKKAGVDKEETARKDSIKAALDNAVASGKIAPGERDKWEEDFKDGYASTLRILDRLPENPTLAKQSAASAKEEDRKDTKAPRRYDTAFARNADPAILKHVEQELSES